MLESSLRRPGKAHSLKGIKGAKSCRQKSYGKIYGSLDEFFERLKEEATPFATRIIREQTGTTTRDDNPDDVVLPLYMTKHKIYTATRLATSQNQQSQ
eukprot:1136749-Ditylum_brightwellii.AAC.1